MKKIIPVILTNDINELELKLTKLQDLVDWIQIDIMDGKFVKNISVNIKDLKNIKKMKINFEAHLMVMDPQNYFQDCKKIGFKRVVFHIEAVKNINQVLNKIKQYDFQKGIAINPETSVEKIVPYLESIDLILILGVNPGFGGQELIQSTYKKISKIKKIMPKIIIEVDGGVNAENIKKLSNAGAEYFAVGASLFKNNNIKGNLKKLKKII